MKFGSLRILAPALVCWGITAVLVLRPSAAPWCLLACSALGGILGVSALRGRSLPVRQTFSVLVVGCALMLILGTRVWMLGELRADPVLTQAAADGRPVTLAMELTGFPEHRADPWGGARGWVQARPIAGVAGVPVRLYVNEQLEADLAPGSVITVSGVLQVTAAGDAAAFAMRVTEIAEDHSPQFSLVATIRTGLRGAAESIPSAALVPGFAVGDTSLVSEDLQQAMRDSSLTHLTAVSGANCALVTGAIIWMLARCGAGRRLRILAAAVALGGFVVLVGPDASVQRAAVMAAVLLLAGFGGKRAAALPALGIAIAVLLFADPWQSLQPGFALSVLATAGILAAASPLAHWLRLRVRVPQFLALPVAVALAAQIACAPVLLLLQPGIPAVGLLANVIAAPAVPVGTALGLFAALLSTFSPFAAQLIVIVASYPAAWVAATAQVTSSLPLARWHWVDGWPGALLLVACQAALGVAWALHRGYLGLPGGERRAWRVPWQPSPATPRSVRLSIALLVGAAAGVCMAVIVVTPVGERLRTPGDWAIVACDVGQGDAILLRDPATPQQVMLVDTGDTPELLTTCLDRFGVDRISLLVLSHDDRDHSGALSAIIDRVDVALISPPAASQHGEEREVVMQLQEAGIPTTVGAEGLNSAQLFPHAGADTRVDSGMQWHVLAPRHTARPVDTNSASLVLRVSVAQLSVLLLGDTGNVEQRTLLREQPSLSADIVKVAHHGSRDQEQHLFAAAGVRWALISVGADNGYGHPAPDTLAALERAGAGVVRTDLMGTVAFIPDAAGPRIWVERSDRAPVSARP